MNIDLLDELRKYKVKMVYICNDPNSTLNKYVEQIYVINMVQDTRKRNYIHLLFKKYNINYNLVVVDKVCDEVYTKLFQHSKLSSAELGCTMSHMWCLIHILKKCFKNAIIFEDDVIFKKTFIEDFIHLLNINPEIDFMLLGAHDFNYSRNNFKKVENNLYRPDFDDKFPLYGAHANYYSYNGAKRMFFIRGTNLSFFDNEYHLLFDTLPNSYICSPNLVIANMNESGISSTHKKNFCSQHEHTYYNCCFKDFNFNKYNLIYHNIFDKSLFKDTLTVEEFIHCCLKKIIPDNDDKLSVIKTRFSMHFFSIQDIGFLLQDDGAK